MQLGDLQLDSDNIEFQKALELIESGNPITFLTGKAGTGKTTFLKYLRQTTKKQTVVLAPTGMAAIQAKGQTIHSFFKINPFTLFLPNHPNETRLQTRPKSNGPKDGMYFYDCFNYNFEKKAIIQALELLIIDEVSMVRCEMLDVIDKILRISRNSLRPFGGVQVVLIGDPFQLPPIVKKQTLNKEEWDILFKNLLKSELDNSGTYTFKDLPVQKISDDKYIIDLKIILEKYGKYNCQFFFASHVLNENEFAYIELEKIYRQKELEFIELLNRVRFSAQTENDLLQLNSKYQPNFVPKNNEKYILLASTNDTVERINIEKLRELTTPLCMVNHKISGIFKKPDYPTGPSDVLELKIGSQIVFIKNDYETEKDGITTTKKNRFANGTIGEILSIEERELSVKLSDGRIIKVEKTEFRNILYVWNKDKQQIEEKIIGTFTQFPVRLAWAITVHKSQGQTFEKVILDVGDAFTDGQVYVALSRCTSFSGIILVSKISNQAIKTAPEVIDFTKLKSPDSLILKNINSGKANQMYSEAYESLKQYQFIEAYQKVLQAIRFRNDTETPNFPRWINTVFSRLVFQKQLLQDQNASLSQDLEDANTEIDSLNNNNTALQKNFNEEQKRVNIIINQLQSKIKQKEDTISILQQSEASLKEECLALGSSLYSKTEQNAELTLKIVQLNANNDLKDKQISSLLEQKTELENEINKIRFAYNALLDENKRLANLKWHEKLLGKK